MNLDQNAPRKLLVQPGRDGDEWTVRIDDFNVFGTGASREAAFDNLAAAVRRMFDAGALASASPVTAKQLRQERRLHSWFWAALKKRPLAQVDYTTLQSLLDRAS